MNPVLTASRPRSSRLTSAATGLMVIAIASAVILAFARLGITDTVTYRTLTVENPTPYIINVEVTSAKRDGWFDVGTVPRGRHQTFQCLADPGAEWLFRFP
mgnify:CR=1 FL=1